jgi:hypothetical protein
MNDRSGRHKDGTIFDNKRFINDPNTSCSSKPAGEALEIETFIWDAIELPQSILAPGRPSHASGGSAQIPREHDSAHQTRLRTSLAL